MRKNKFISFCKKFKVQIIILLLVIIVWFGDSIIDSIFFYKEPFQDIAVLNVPYFEYYFRFSLIALLIIIGFIIVRKNNEQKRAKTVLDKEREQMLKIFDSISQPIYIIDPKNHELLYTNKALREIYGEDVSKKCHDYFLDNPTVCSGCLMPEIEKIGADDVYPREFYNEKTGRYFGCIDRKMKWSDGRDVIYTFSIDITEQRKIESERSRANKFETMEVLADTLVHDFNNLLATMIMSISVAKDYSKNLEKVTSLLSMAEDAAYRAKDITHQLLTFTKRSEPQLENVNFQRILKESTDLVLRESKIEYDISIDKNISNILIDVGQVVQVVNNLLINAKQAIMEKEKGKITAGMHNADPNKVKELLNTDSKYICITVQDNGTGITKENMSKIFTPYFTTKENGLGLGLASCFSIIKKHNGIITVDSTFKEGTVFSVYLPASKRKSTQNEKVDENVDTNIRILFVEDDELVGSVTGIMIKHLGYKIKVENDENRAIEIFKSQIAKKEPVNIVMIDLTAPHNISPKEILNRFKVIDPEIKSILTSGIDSDTILKEYVEFGFNAVLKKPFRTSDIVSAVNRALSSN